MPLFREKAAGTIGIWNRSEYLSARDVDQMVRACAWQIARHVCPAWGLRRIDVVSVNGPPKDMRLIQLVDGPADADAWGYHDEEESGRHTGVVFVEELLDAGATKFTTAESVSATLSHEACEMVINGDLNRWADDGAGRFYWQEICDPVQDEAYTVRIRKRRVAVSNFVLPSWFDRENPSGVSFDYLERLGAPFEITLGGWALSMYDGELETAFGEAVGACSRDGGLVALGQLVSLLAQRGGVVTGVVGPSRAGVEVVEVWPKDQRTKHYDQHEEETKLEEQRQVDVEGDRGHHRKRRLELELQRVHATLGSGDGGSYQRAYPRSTA